MSIFKRLQAKKQAKKKHDLVKSELTRRLWEFTKGLDAEALEIVEDLVGRLGELNNMDTPDGLDVVDVVGFNGEHAGVIFGTIDAAKREDIEVDIDKLVERQFATFAETALYTEGTHDLIGLLMRYHRIKTEKAVITAVPDSSTYHDGRPVITREHLKEDYDNTRVVYISIIFDAGFMMFGFEEKVR
jgi:hypothetical protein